MQDTGLAGDEDINFTLWKQGRIPPAARWTPKPSKKLAYIIGVLRGDGSLIKEHGYYYVIVLLVKDHEFAIEFSKAVAKLLNKKYREPYWSNADSGWRVYYYSKAFHTWYEEQTLDTLKQYIEHSRDTVAHFLRGLYDSEGCNYRCRQIFLYNNSIKLLYYAQYLLKKYFNIVATGPYLNKKAGSTSVKRNGEKIRTNKNNYQIVISRKQCVQSFLNEVGFSIKERQQGLPRRR